jgi:vacuolar iron transporter family protein
VSDKQVEKHPHLPGRNIADRIVLGGSDGVIESTAATAALNGAGVDFRTLLIAGFAFAVAGAVSMFFSNYLSRRSELDSLRIDMERERMEIETEPEEERQELEELLKKEGYQQQEVDVIMKRLTKDKEMWLRAQLTHELHLHMDELATNPVGRSLPAGIAFMLTALVPLVPYLLELSRIGALATSLTLALVALFWLGSMKYLSLSHFEPKKGLESVLVGGAAALLMFIIGRFISAL